MESKEKEDKKKQMTKHIQNVIKKWPKYTLEQKYKAIEQIPGGIAFLEKEYEKHLEEQLKHPTDFALRFIEVWRKRINLPFNLSDRIKRENRQRSEEEKFLSSGTNN